MSRPRRAARPLLARAIPAVALLLAGCGLIPPRPTPPALRQSAPLGADLLQAGGQWPAADWWHAYGDADLDTLIARALERSPSLDAAQARFASAQASVRTAAALLGVHVEANADLSRQRLSDTGLIPPQFLGFHWYDQTDLGLSFQYALDLWGRQRAQITAALDAAHAATAEHAAAALALSTAVAQTYLAWQSDEARLALARERVANLQQQQALAAARVNAAIARADDEQQAAIALNGAQEQLTALSNSARLRQVLLAALLACAPEELPPLTPRPLPPLVAQLPAAAGLDLLARRPEIIAARWRIEAAERGVESARAGFLPDVSLSGLAGLSSVHLDELLRYGSRVPNVGVAIHLPLFDAGRLRGEYEGSRAQLRAAIAAYDDAIVSAAREVGTQAITRADLLARRAARLQAQALADALRAAAGARAAAGITDARPQLSADAQWLDSTDALLQLDAAALQTDVDLVRALGGGYLSADFTAAATASTSGSTP